MFSLGNRVRLPALEQKQVFVGGVMIHQLFYALLALRGLRLSVILRDLPLGASFFGYSDYGYSATVVIANDV